MKSIKKKFLEINIDKTFLKRTDNKKDSLRKIIFLSVRLEKKFKIFAGEFLSTSK